MNYRYIALCIGLIVAIPAAISASSSTSSTANSNEQEQDICPYCRDPLNGSIIELQCDPIRPTALHAFHTNCLSNWVYSNPDYLRNCPLCNSDLSPSSALKIAGDRLTNEWNGASVEEKKVLSEFILRLARNRATSLHMIQNQQPLPNAVHATLQAIQPPSELLTLAKGFSCGMVPGYQLLLNQAKDNTYIKDVPSWLLVTFYFEIISQAAYQGYTNITHGTDTKYVFSKQHWIRMMGMLMGFAFIYYGSDHTWF